MPRRLVFASLVSMGVLGGFATNAFADETAPATTAASPAAEEGGGGMRSPGSFGIGITLATLGTVGLGIGGYFFSSGDGSCSGLTREQVPTDAEVVECTAGVNQQVAGVIALVTGGAFVLGGIPLIISGAISEDPEAPAQAALRLSPTGADLQIVF